jgi:hypothetical protein
MEHTISPLLRSRQFLFSLGVLLLCSAQQGFTATTKDYIDTDKGRDAAPSGKGWGEQPNIKSPELANFPGKGGAASKGSAGTTSNGISYRGGPLLNSSKTTIYYIWYGNWSGNSATTILPALANSMGGSSYFNINTTYYDGKVLHVPNSSSSLILYSPQAVTATTAPYSTSLSDADIQNIVKSAITTPTGGGTSALPSDPNGLYFVLTSSDVNESSGFCTKYCGWHTHGSINGTDIKYSFVGNPDRCPSACEAQTTSPNGNAGADGMASIIAHELEEAVTDPDLNAWYDTRGRENADKCAWTFGSTYKVANGSLANMKLPSTCNTCNYLIQQNWVNAGGGYCSKSY